MKKLILLIGFCMVLCTISASAQNTPQILSDREYRMGGEPQPHPHTIYVKTRIDGTTRLIPVLVFFSDLVGWVKQDIAYMLEIPVDSFELTFGGAVLDEELPLNAYGITVNSILGLRYL